MDEVKSNFGDFEGLKNSIIEEAIVDESWESLCSQELTKKMLNDIDGSFQRDEKLKRITFNCVMELLTMSIRFFLNNGNFKTHFAFSIINGMPHIFLSFNRHELSTTTGLASLIDEHDKSDKKTLKKVFREIIKTSSEKYPTDSLSIIDLLRKSGNPIYYQLIPQKEQNPIIEFIVRVSV